MHTVRRQIVEIPVEQLNDIDRMFGRMLSLDLENIPVKFQTAFDQTRGTSFQNFTMYPFLQPRAKRHPHRDAGTDLSSAEAGRNRNLTEQ